jgi:hypothetical protein
MRCDDIREQFDTLWDGEFPPVGELSPEFRQHIAQCVACGQYFRDMGLVRAGFEVLKHEAPPEPSIGFAERLVRQLGDLGKQPSVSEFFERVGRRFVYTTLVLAFLMLLAMALPETGPVRGQAAADVLMPSQEATLLRPDPLGEISSQDVSDALPVEPQPPSATPEEGK